MTIRPHRVPAVVALALLVATAALRAEPPAEGKDGHWSLRPVTRQLVPAVRDAAWVRNPIDAFVLAKLEGQGLAPSAAADSRTLIRRLSFDLTGLPPTPEEVSAFVSDASPDAYEKLVDRLLASPAYGERWGRHWLDVAHYADTHGFERDQRRPNAWRYRDWVIDALNRDLPYDEFIRLQIAGDVVAPQDPAAVTATGFLAAGPFDYVGQVETMAGTLRRQARADDLDDMVTQVITSTVGLTINCARCHDHKFDPISQAEYYRLWAVFAGVTRGDRTIDAKVEAERKRLGAEIAALGTALAGLPEDAVDLADVVAGGDGSGAAPPGRGIDPRSGAATEARTDFLAEIKLNQYARTTNPLVDGVFIPDGGEGGQTAVPVSSTGITVTGLPKTSAASWDYVTKGPFSLLQSTVLGGVDYAQPPHSMLGLHANKGITFDLDAVRAARPGRKVLRFTAVAGNGGVGRADFHVYVDGKPKVVQIGITEISRVYPVDVELAEGDRFLTLIATDGAGDIGSDQIFFGDPKLVLSPAPGEESVAAATEAERTRIARARADAAARLAALPPEHKVYGAVPGEVPPVHLLKRGDPESPGDAVTPGTVACVGGSLPSDLGDATTPEGQRRLALADWIVHPDNPLTARVVVNRLWHHHFGRGIVDTPSDFGRNGGPPSHPELLDWLASEMRERKWSLKAMHRLMVTSNTYRQRSTPTPAGLAADADNRLLWRMNPRRLEAEAVRDSVLAATGKLNRQAGGPGFEPFNYVDKYAPVYEYVTADRPEVWRRSVYAFVVRSVPNPFMDVLDCPNPSNLTPARSSTTTALQALALLNNPFMLRQAHYFAERVAAEAGTPEAQVARAYELAFARPPSAAEVEAGRALVGKRGLLPFCRVLLNANEFVHVD
jgi:hypothetical protein